MKRLILLGAAIGMLAGCATQPKEIIVTQTVTRYVGMEDAWLQSCPTPTPPTQSVEYSDSDFPSRVDLWAEWYLMQIEQTGVRNKALEAARKYNLKKKQESTTVTCKEGSCK